MSVDATVVEQIDAVLAEYGVLHHVKYNGYCDACRDTWPCGTYEMARHIAASRRPVDDGRQVERTRAWLLQQVSYQQRAQPSDGYTLGMYDAYRAVLHYIDTASQDEDATPSEEAE